eukprot:scaffold319572_cov70-Cyclotella_meneghiniana.AAC.1
MMTLPRVVEGGIVLDVHVTAPAVGFTQRRRQPVHAVTAFDHALPTEGGDATRLVRFGAAFGT